MSQVTKPLKSLLKASESRLQRNYIEAINAYHDSAKASEKDFRVCAAIAYCYRALAENNTQDPAHCYEEAIRWLKEAVELAPNNGRLRAQLAELFSTGLYDYSNASIEYRKAIEAAPNDAWVLVSAASLYGVPEEVIAQDEAILWLERATELEPDDPNILARLGELYYAAGRQNEAQLVWMNATTCSRPLSEGYYNKITELLRY